jgi:hypothetical protein
MSDTLKRLNKRALADWLEERAQEHSDKWNALLAEAHHLKLALPRCDDPWSVSKRIQECEAMAANEMLYCVGLRLEKNALEAKP